jgi:hypothetical protein
MHAEDQHVHELRSSACIGEWLQAGFLQGDAGLPGPSADLGVTI